MAGFTLDAPTIESQSGADAQYMKGFYYWLKGRYGARITNIGNAAQLTAAGITDSTDQNRHLALNIDMNTLIAAFEANATLILNDCNFLVGVN